MRTRLHPWTNERWRRDLFSPRTSDSAERSDGVAVPHVISAQAPSQRERLVALVAVMTMVAAFLAALPFRHVQLARLDAFVPIDNTLIFACSILTATLLYGQYAVACNPKLLALAGSCVFSALLLVPYTLTFLRSFASPAPIGSLQSTPWLYLIRQVGVMAGFIAYAVIRAPAIRARGKNRGIARSIVANLALATAAALVATWITIAKAEWLPPIMQDPVHTTGSYNAVVMPAIVLLTMGAIVVFGKARETILDLWVQVAAVSWVLQLWLVSVVAARFSLVFYVSRTLGMVSASVVLIALVAESMMLHTKVALSLAARDQERAGRRTEIEVMMGAIAHELRQPLAAILTNGDAGGLLLTNVPGADAAREVLGDISSSARRAGEILDSVKSQFTPSPTERRTVDVNDLVRQAIRANRMDLDERKVGLHTELAPDLALVRGHHGQLLQVLVNGLTNAMDALPSSTDRPREIAIRTVRQSSESVSILIEDSGDGIDDEASHHLFEPFRSTKQTGTGLGLVISRSIIEAHGGRLSLANGPVRGAVFRVDLPLGAAPGQ